MRTLPVFTLGTLLCFSLTTLAEDPPVPAAAEAAPAVEKPAQEKPAAEKKAKKKKGAKKEAKGKVTKSTTGLVMEDVVVGTGKAAASGNSVSVHYTGTLDDKNKTKFDSSRDRNEPFTFELGKGFVIKGWDEGVAGMKVGGKRKLTIPPDLGYGAAGAGAAIPPNSVLLFDVELLEVR